MTFFEKAYHEQARRELLKASFTVTKNPNWGDETKRKRPYQTAAWKRVRLVVLERDQWICQVRRPGCTKQAIDCDHIESWQQGGSWYDPTNLRASCSHCNNSRVKHGLYEKWRYKSIPTTLVIGPPLPGLLRSYVLSQSRSNDYVIDYESIAIVNGITQDELNQGGLFEQIIDKRQEQIDLMRSGKIKADRIWITSSNANAESMIIHTDKVIVDPGLDDCLDKIKSGGIAPRFSNLVIKWYEERKGIVHTTHDDTLSAW